MHSTTVLLAIASLASAADVTVLNLGYEQGDKAQHLGASVVAVVSTLSSLLTSSLTTS